MHRNARDVIRLPIGGVLSPMRVATGSRNGPPQDAICRRASLTTSSTSHRAPTGCRCSGDVPGGLVRALLRRMRGHRAAHREGQREAPARSPARGRGRPGCLRRPEWRVWTGRGRTMRRARSGGRSAARRAGVLGAPDPSRWCTTSMIPRGTPLRACPDLRKHPCGRSGEPHGCTTCLVQRFSW